MCMVVLPFQAWEHRFQQRAASPFGPEKIPPRRGPPMYTHAWPNSVLSPTINFYTSLSGNIFLTDYKRQMPLNSVLLYRLLKPACLNSTLNRHNFDNHLFCFYSSKSIHIFVCKNIYFTYVLNIYFYTWHW